jgi:gliding motility-associated-like protein
MKCSSIDPSGGEFYITPAIAPIVSATGIGCSNSFDMDSLVLTLGSAIPPGKYKISSKPNSAGLTLLDNCDRTIPVTDSEQIEVYPLIPTPMDSVTPVFCRPNTLQLVFKKPMMCSTIEPGGTDFLITGPSTITIISATGICDESGLTNTINISLFSPITKGGSYIITLKKGTDGNTIKNECSMETATGSKITFTAYDTVSAVFNTIIHLGCSGDTIHYLHTNPNSVTSWLWQFDNNITSSQPDTSIIYYIFGTKNSKLLVSNGVCSDSTFQTVALDNELKASFEGSTLICPSDSAIFADKSIGKIVKWTWDFDNGNQSILQQPPYQKYPSGSLTREYLIKMIVTNDMGCSDTASQTLTVFNTCTIAVASAFTPNGDGLNDYLYPINAYKARDLTFNVYNRLGQLVFSSHDWQKKWDGTFHGQPQDAGTYVWFLQYTHVDTGKKYFLKGTSVLIR